MSPVGSDLNRRERSPAPRFDRSDSVTPTNELADEESVTPRSVSPSPSTPPPPLLYFSCVFVQKEGVKDAGQTLAGTYCIQLIEVFVFESVFVPLYFSCQSEIRGRIVSS